MDLAGRRRAGHRCCGSWFAGSWDARLAVRAVSSLLEKLALAAEYGAAAFFVPASPGDGQAGRRVGRSGQGHAATARGLNRPGVEVRARLGPPRVRPRRSGAWFRLERRRGGIGPRLFCPAAAQQHLRGERFEQFAVQRVCVRAPRVVGALHASWQAPVIVVTRTGQRLRATRVALDR